MPDIVHALRIESSADRVFAGIATPTGMNAWWTLTFEGTPKKGEFYELGFGEGYEWRAEVVDCMPDHSLELIMREAESDWMDTRIGFQLVTAASFTELRFHHSGWSRQSDHFRHSSYCWAMYLRLLKRYLERGEIVPYAERLNA